MLGKIWCPYSLGIFKVWANKCGIQSLDKFAIRKGVCWVNNRFIQKGNTAAGDAHYCVCLVNILSDMVFEFEIKINRPSLQKHDQVHFHIFDNGACTLCFRIYQGLKRGNCPR